MKYTDNMENILQLIVNEMKMSNDIKKDIATSLNNMDITLEEMTDVLKNVQVTIEEHNQEINDIKNNFIPVVEDDPEQKIILETSDESEVSNESKIHITCFSEDETIKENSKKGIFCIRCKTHNIFFNKEKKKMICINCYSDLKEKECKSESIERIDNDDNELLKGIMEFQKK